METIKTKNGTSFKETVRVNGKKVSKSFKRKTDAQIWKQEILVEKRKGSFLNLNQDSKIIFEQVALKWIDQKIKSKSRKTLYEYQSICRKHLCASFGNLPIASIKTSHADKLVTTLRGLGRHPKTINKIISVFKQIMRFAVKERLLRNFAFDQVESLPEPERPFEFFIDKEIEKMLRASVGTQMHSILMIALNTGMRLGEIFGLKWDKVFFNEGYLTASRKMTRYGLEQFTKTKIIRHIGLNKELEFELKKLRKTLLTSEFVISDEKGQPLSPDHFNERNFKPFLTKLEIRQLRFHDLRHTYASHYMMSGGSIYDLQNILGHTTSNMTQKYAHLSAGHLIKAASKIGFSTESESNLIELSLKCPLKEKEIISSF